MIRSHFLVLLFSLLCFFFCTIFLLQEDNSNQKKENLVAENESFLLTLSLLSKAEIIQKVAFSSTEFYHILFFDSQTRGIPKVFQRTIGNREFLNDPDLFIKIADLNDTPEIIQVNSDVYWAVKTADALASDNQITLVTLVPYEEVNGLTPEVIFPLLSIMCVLLVFSCVIMYKQSQKITKPLGQIGEISQEYARRDFSKSLNVKTGDEVEELSRNVSNMVQQLRDFEGNQIALFRNLSHELKTPLTAISGFAEGIELGNFPDDTKALRIIQEESKRMKKIIEDLIFLSKLNTQTEEYNFQVLDLVSVMIQSLEKVESIAIQKEIILEFSPPSPVFLEGDDGKLMRIFINLLSNALKHAEKQVLVELTQNQTGIFIYINDDGKGFSPEFLKQGVQGMSPSTMDGNGLGLMIVSEIVKVHNGTISFSNRSGTGGKVTISFQ